MLVSDFHYQLPSELIAQFPLPDRADARMLRLERSSGAIQDLRFRDFLGLLRQSDLLVFNNTRVFPARLFGRKVGNKNSSMSRNLASSVSTEGRIEVLLTRQVSEDTTDWDCLVRPGRKVAVGDALVFEDGESNGLLAEVTDRGPFGERRLHFTYTEDFFTVIERLGHVPLPPYINRGDSRVDKERYQTVYARERGSIAAPTAGLHFTPEILAEIATRGIETAEVTLHVGLGTFQPIRVDQVEEHKIHSEHYVISPRVADAINNARRANRRVIAIGTTTVRTLENCASNDPGGQIAAGKGEANIFIYPGYKFRAVDAILTNFHLPQSTLLMLISAFAGRKHVLAAYNHGVAQKYRFYSYGDCMFIE